MKIIQVIIIKSMLKIKEMERILVDMMIRGILEITKIELIQVIMKARNIIVRMMFKKI